MKTSLKGTKLTENTEEGVFVIPLCPLCALCLCERSFRTLLFVSCYLLFETLRLYERI
jgi:predicted GNAT family acetyltransferase